MSIPVGNKKLRVFSAILTAAILTTIFLLSAQTADKSSETSLSLLALFFDEETQLLLHGLVRKLAHMTEYAALGASAFLFAATFPVSRRAAAAFPFAGAVLYACTDELHQTFVDGRSAQLSDILIDSSGAAAGILFVSLLIIFIQTRKRKKDVPGEKTMN